MGNFLYQSQRTLAQTARFQRRTLYIFALLLSATITCAAGLFINDSLTRFFEERGHYFTRNFEYTQKEVLRLSSRLVGIVDLYESNWALNQQEYIPLEHYREQLRKNGGVTITGYELTTTPFLIVERDAKPDNPPSLSAMLHILRRISAASAFDIKRDITVSGFLYSPDQSLAAAAPIFRSPCDKASVTRERVDAFLRSHVASIESLVNSDRRSKIHANRPLWTSLLDQGHKQWIAEMILPIFHSRDRLATLVAQIPVDQFMQYFVDPAHPLGFFVLRANGVEPLTNINLSEKERSLLRTIQTHTKWLQHVSNTRQIIRDGLIFIVAQRIDGSGWVVVYAFDWKSMSGTVIASVALSMSFAMFALAILWAGVIYFDSRVARPSERDAQGLIDAEALNRSIVDTAPVGITVFDPGGKIILLENDAAKHLVGRCFSSNVLFYARALEARAHVSPNSRDKAFPKRAFHELSWAKDARENHIGVASSCASFEGKDVVLFGLVDLTERKTSEAMLLGARLAANKANQEKSMFMAMIAHEIRTPLHGARGHLELLSTSSLTRKQLKHVTLIQSSLEALQSLIDDLLDATRIESKALTINPRPIHLNRIVEHCAQRFAPTIQGRGLALHCYTDSDLDQPVEADDQRLMQILQNLLGNAAKFTQHGSITLSTRLLRREEAQVWVRIEVADTGTGLPAALQAMVFKPSMQAGRTGSRNHGRSGLGLLLCENLADLMGGTITFQGEPNLGSVFGIEVPLAWHADVAGIAEASLAPMLIDLRVEDMRLFDMLKSRLERWGATIASQQSGNAIPDVRLIASANIQMPVTIDSTEPRMGVIYLDARGPVAPSRIDATITASVFSSDALLAALLDLSRTDTTDLSHSVRQSCIASELNVLIAEDDPVSRALLVFQLQALGYTRIRSAVDGKEALEMWLEQEPDVVLTNLSMPYLSGIELLEKIRQRNPNARVVATTTAGSPDLSPKIAQDFTSFLHKPIVLAELRDILISS